MKIRKLSDTTDRLCNECDNKGQISVYIREMDESVDLCVIHAKELIEELQKTLNEIKDEKSTRVVNEFFLACIQAFNPSLLNLTEVQKWKEEKNIKERKLNEFLGVET